MVKEITNVSVVIKALFTKIIPSLIQIGSHPCMVPVAAVQNTVRMYHRTVHLLVLLQFFRFLIMHRINIVKFKIN